MINLHSIVEGIDRLLTQKRVIGYCKVIILAFLLVLPLFHVFVTDLSVYIKDKDFLAFYTAGQIIKDGPIGNLYDPVYQFSLQKYLVDEIFVPFINPPPYAMLMLPFAYLSYNFAFILWNMISVTIALLSFKFLKKALVLRVQWWDILIIFLASTVAFETLMSGQNSLLFFGVYVASFLLIKRGNDFLAGLILSIGILKPQLFLFLPIMLLWQKRWRIVSGGLVGLIVISGFTILVFGLDGVTSYINFITTSNIYLEGIQKQYYMMYTLTSLIRLVTNDYFSPFLISFVISLLSLYLILAKKEQNIEETFSIAIIGTLLISPHLLRYDLVLLALPFVLFYNWNIHGFVARHEAIQLRVIMAAIFVFLWLSYMGYYGFLLMTPLLLYLLYFTYKIRLNKKVVKAMIAPSP